MTQALGPRRTKLTGNGGRAGVKGAAGGTRGAGSAIEPEVATKPTRLDVALVNRRLAASREKGKAAIEAGLVFVNGKPADKPSLTVGPIDVVEVRGETLRYVGRGGLKLEKALACFGIDLTGRRCLDIGSSTGGFTDCMLQTGAAHVFSVDVGHGQLHPALTSDPRVTPMEGTDIRNVETAHLGGPVDFAATDVSFIPLGLVLPHIARLVKPDGAAVCLIKPQFEAGPENVGKRGIVKDPRVHHEVIRRVARQAREAGLATHGLDFSPIRGGDGNIEYLLHLRAPGAATTAQEARAEADAQFDAAIAGVVERAHAVAAG